jgi:hypothetical protein
MARFATALHKINGEFRGTRWAAPERMQHKRSVQIGLQFIERHAAHRSRVPHAAFRGLNDFFGDNLGDWVVARGQTERAASVEEGETHGFDQFRIECLPPQKGCDWHWVAVIFALPYFLSCLS